MSGSGILLRGILVNAAPVAAIVGTRVYPLVLPQGIADPAITYQYITGQSVITTDGPVGLFVGTVQIGCWAPTYLAADALYETVRAFLTSYADNTSQGIFIDPRPDFYDNVAKLFRRTADFSIWHKETV